MYRHNFSQFLREISLFNPISVLLYQTRQVAPSAHHVCVTSHTCCALHTCDVRHIVHVVALSKGVLCTMHCAPGPLDIEGAWPHSSKYSGGQRHLSATVKAPKKAPFPLP